MCGMLCVHHPGHASIRRHLFPHPRTLFYLLPPPPLFPQILCSLITFHARSPLTHTTPLKVRTIIIPILQMSKFSSERKTGSLS